MPLSARNDTGADASLRLALAVDGPAAPAGATEQTVQVANGGESLAYFTLKTGEAPGDVALRFTAEGNGERAHASALVPVRADLPSLSEEQGGAVADARLRLPVEAPERFRPGTLRRELRVGDLPLIQFSGKLRDLLAYPYGCLEQTVSAAFPLVYLGDLARRLDPELLAPPKKGEPGKGDPAVFIQGAIRSIELLQLSDGGFSLWPQGTTAQPWASVYAAHFLVEASKAGHPVPDELLARALDYAGGLATAKQQYGSDELERTAYALYVLARAGRADLGTMDFLREKHAGELAPDARALLAAAYAAVGNPRALGELLAGLERGGEGGAPDRGQLRLHRARPRRRAARPARRRPRQPAHPGAGGPPGPRRPRAAGVDDAGERLGLPRPRRLRAATGPAPPLRRHCLRR